MACRLPKRFPRTSCGLNADLCKLPVLFLLPNGRFSEFLECTAFIGFLNTPQAPNYHLHFGDERLGIVIAAGAALSLDMGERFGMILWTAEPAALIIVDLA